MAAVSGHGARLLDRYANRLVVTLADAYVRIGDHQAGKH